MSSPGTNLPAEFDTASRRFEASDWEQRDIFTNTPVYVHMLRQSVQGSRRAIALTAEPGFVKPDLLAYWIPGMPKAAEGLPDNAVFLGTFNATALPLPDEAMKMDGSIILYSLADGEVVDVSRSVRFNASTK